MVHLFPKNILVFIQQGYLLCNIESDYQPRIYEKNRTIYAHIREEQDMHTSKQLFCVAVLVLFVSQPAFSRDSLSHIDPALRAASHTITVPRPAPNFFEGALLGNGGLGAVVTTRPDAVVIHFGHNDVWDIRLAEDNKEKIGTFRDIFDRVSAIPDTLDELTDDPWYSDYLKVMRENYAKPYPRPFPCGSVVLWFDRRETELIGHTLHIDSGTAVVDFLIDESIHHLEIFTDLSEDVLWAKMTGPDGTPIPSPFAYITIIPDPETPKELPGYTAMRDDIAGMLSFAQVMPFEEDNRITSIPKTSERQIFPSDRENKRRISCYCRSSR